MTLVIPSGGIPVGARLHNRYRVDGYLGGGVNGQVYQVWDERQSMSVALKILLKMPPAGWWSEAESLTALRGGYILPILNADDDAGLPFVVTEIMNDGATSDQIVTGVGVEPDRAALWIQQAAIGVARIHDSHRLHTDLKPENLFLDREDRVLVGDLGLSMVMDANGHGPAAGSPQTMAPEVAAGGPTTVQSDVYSLGSSLYELLAGDWLNPSLRRLTGPAVFAAVASHQPRALGDVAPHVHSGLRSIVMKALAKDPADRYQSAAELAAAIGARTLPPRRWHRDQPCAGHRVCFTGTRSGAIELKVCVVPTPQPRRFEIQTIRRPSGRRVNPWPIVMETALSQRLRGVLRSRP